jgi:HEAT repeat protein
MSRLLCSLVIASALLLAACKGDPNTPEFWEKQITSAKRTKDKVRAVEDLRESKKMTPAFAPMLHAHLASEKSPETKGAIARLLGELRDPSSVEPLIDALDLGAADSNIFTMDKEIATALGMIGDKKAIPTLMKLLKIKDNYTKIESIVALGSLKAKEAVPALTDIATDEGGEPFISKKAIQALGDIGDPAAVPALIKMMYKERRGVSFYVEASFALYQIGQPAADALIPVVRNEDKALVEWAKTSNVIEAALWAKAAQVLGDLHEQKAEKDLIKMLGFNSDFLDVKLFVRMRAADALGRIRSKEAVPVLAKMLEEEEATARNEYIRALNRIGGRDAIPALVKSESKGSWDAREPSIVAVAMLGDEREVPAFEGFVKAEEKLTTDECKENPDYTGCNDPAALVKKHVEMIETHRKRIDAAKECKADGACWAKKLDDKDQGVRERAAYEVGRSNNPALIDELTKRLQEKNLDARLAIIQATDWLVHDSKDAAKRAGSVIPALDKQIAEERGKTEFVKVNEDLRRLAVKLKRASGAGA